MNSPTVEGNPCLPFSYATRNRLITLNYCVPCCAVVVRRLLGDTLHGECLGEMYGGTGLPKRQNPLSTSLVGSKGVQSTTPGTKLAAGAAGTCQELTYDRLRGSTPDFLSGFNHTAFVSPETPIRQWGGGCNKIFPSPRLTANKCQ